MGMKSELCEDVGLALRVLACCAVQFNIGGKGLRPENQPLAEWIMLRPGRALNPKLTSPICQGNRRLHFQITIQYCKNPKSLKVGYWRTKMRALMRITVRRGGRILITGFRGCMPSNA